MLSSSFFVLLITLSRQIYARFFSLEMEENIIFLAKFNFEWSAQ